VPWWKKFLWERNLSNMSNDNEVNTMNFKCDIAELKSLPHPVKTQQVVEAITSKINKFSLECAKNNGSADGRSTSIVKSMDIFIGRKSK
jgi:hypothetical protein